jgi:hypothetical protein
MSAINWGTSPVPFVPGLDLSERFYHEEVAGILARRFPGLPHTAGLIGYGSDVLGLDTPMSRDHMWGPRLALLLPESGFDLVRRDVDTALREELPTEFLGYPTHFGSADGEGVRIMQARECGPVDHLIEITTLRLFWIGELGIDPSQPLSARDWLAFPEQKLLMVTGGKLYHDDLEVEAARMALRWYPRDVWLYLLACGWQQVAQEEPFVGRTGDLGDELGSRLITARLAQAFMRLAFLLEQRYAPYSKWFGTAFRKLALAGPLEPRLQAALRVNGWPEREQSLIAAAQVLVEAQNRLGFVAPQDAAGEYFHGRPFQVVHAGRIAEALREAIADPELRRLPLYGSVSQSIRSTDILEDPPATRRLAALYDLPPAEKP